MWHDMHWDGWGGHMFGWWGIVIMGLLIVGVALIIAWSRSGRERQPVSDNETAMDILERRYAQGEIDRDEYEKKKRDLES